MASTSLLEKKLIELLSTYSIGEIEKTLAKLKPSEDKKTQSNEPSSELAELPQEVDDNFKAEALKLFNLADVDSSGTIDESELYNLLKELIGPITLPESNRIYHDMDTNKSGTITFDEFLVGLVKYKWDIQQIDSVVEKHQQKHDAFEWEIPYAELKLGARLGKGCYGTVYQAKWRGIQIACKKLRFSDEEDILIQFKNEVAILGKLRHPNVLLFMGACTEKQNLCIITEFLEGGSVGDLIKKEKLPIKKILSFSKQTSFGCNYLHLSSILHRDLKPDNLLLDAHHNLKLCDFGLSIIKPTQGVLTKGIGSPVWQSPEMLKGEPYVETTDVYSFAITVWGLFGKEMLDDPNFEEVEDYDGLVKAVAKQGKRPIIPSTCPAELAQLIRSCWDSEAKKRPNFAQIIAHLERISNSL